MRCNRLQYSKAIRRDSFSELSFRHVGMIVIESKDFVTFIAKSRMYHYVLYDFNFIISRDIEMYFTPSVRKAVERNGTQYVFMRVTYLNVLT